MIIISASTYLRVIYEGKDITRDMSPYITGFTFTDNSGSNSDDIAITLQDRNLLWLKEWTPSKSDRINASIIHEGKSLDCGTFEVDQVEYSMPPHVMNIKAVSCAISKSARNENHNRAWEDTTLREIFSDIAGDNGLDLFYDAEDFIVERREQLHESDLSFLSDMAGDFGLNIKVADNKLIVYSEDSYADAQSVAVITSDSKHLISAKFTSKSANVYRKARVKYHHPAKNVTYEAEYEDDDEEGSERELEIYTRVDSQEQAETVARESLKKANSKEVTATITLKGGHEYSAGLTVTLEGFGMFSGKYLIDKATHVIGSGWVTTLDLKMGGNAKSAVKKYKAKSRKNARTSGGELFADDSEGY